MGRGTSKAGGVAIGGGGKKYLSVDKALYESEDEDLVVERLTHSFGSDTDVLEASSDGKGNITLGKATPVEYFEQNKKTTYAVYDVKCGVTNAPDVRRAEQSKTFQDRVEKYGYYNAKSKVQDPDSDVRSAGIDWDKVKTVSGQTYNVKSLLKDKGFKWDKANKVWSKE